MLKVIWYRTDKWHRLATSEQDEAERIARELRADGYRVKVLAEDEVPGAVVCLSRNELLLSNSPS